MLQLVAPAAQPAEVPTTSPADRAMADFLLAIEIGRDKLMPVGQGTALQWPVSRFLGDLTVEQQRLLFCAAHAALMARPPNFRACDIAAADSVVTLYMRAFVASVARSYATELMAVPQ